jgi:hypothetical protein
MSSNQDLRNGPCANSSFRLVDEILAEIVANAPSSNTRSAGFVVMKRPAISGGAALANGGHFGTVLVKM